MSKWKFGKLISFAMSAALMFTSVVPANAQGLDDVPALDENAEITESAPVAEENPDEISGLMTAPTQGGNMVVTVVLAGGTSAAFESLDGYSASTDGGTYTVAYEAAATHVDISSLVAISPAKENYDFAGWTIEPQANVTYNSTTHKLDISSDESLNGSATGFTATATATYTAHKTIINITQDKGGSPNAGATITLTDGGYDVNSATGNIAIPDPAAWAGHTFIGWTLTAVEGAALTAFTNISTDQNLTVDAAALQAAYAADADTHTLNLTITANWTVDPVESGIAYYAVLGEDAPAVMDTTQSPLDAQSFPVKYYDTDSNITIPAPASAYQTYYTFAGWYKDADCTIPLTVDGSNYVYSLNNNTGIINIYAKYNPVSFDVTYNENTASSRYTSVEYANGKKPSLVTYGTDLVVGIPTRENYDFAGFDFGTTANATSIIAYNASASDYAAKVTIDKTAKTYTLKTANIIADVKVTAHWTLKDYPITYELDGGIYSPVDDDSTAGVDESVIIEDYQVADGSDPAVVIKLQAATKEGYIFKGWFRNKDHKTDPLTASDPDDLPHSTYTWTVKTTETSGITFYAYFIKDTTLTYKKISYNLRDGAKNNSKNLLEIPTTATSVDFYAPTRTGYNFKGWYKDASLETGITENPTGVWTWSGLTEAMITKGLQVYPKWELATYPVYFAGNGPIPTGQSRTAKYNTLASAIDLFDGATFTKTNYEFDGWYICQVKEGEDGLDGSGDIAPAEWEATTKIADSTTKIAGPTVFYAKWIGAVQTITYNSNYPTEAAAQSSVEVTVRSGDTMTIPANKFEVPKGYKFVGWSTNKNDTAEEAAWKVGSEQAVTFYSYVNDAGETVANAEQVYAIWEVNKITVIFNIGFDDTDAAETVAYHSFPIATIAENYNGTNYTGRGYVQSNTLVGAKIQLTGKEIGRLGYTLKGWKSNKGKTYGPADAIADLSTTAGDYVVLTAQWSKDTYSIKFEGNGGTFGNTLKTTATKLKAYDITTATENIATAATDITKKGYAFGGWFADKSFDPTTELGTGKYASTVANKTAAGYYSATYYAKWTPTTVGLTIKDTSAGTTYNIYPITYGDASTKVSLSKFLKDYPLYSVSQPGAKLVGFESTDGAGKKTSYKTNATFQNLETNLTIYGVWKYNKYSITYDLAGGKQKNAVKSYIAAEKVIDLPTPTKTGYTFEGWEISTKDKYYSYAGYDSAANTLDQTVYGNLKLKAKWKAVTYQVIISDEEESAYAQAEFAYDEKVNFALLAADLQKSAGKEGYAVTKLYKLNGKKKVTYKITDRYPGSKFGKDVLPAADGSDGILRLYAVFSKTALYNIEYAYDTTDDESSDTGLSYNDLQNYPRTYTVKKVSSFKTPKKDGWLFKGWTTSFNSELYANSKTLVKAIKAQGESASDIVLTPNFEKVEFTVLVQPNAKGIKDGSDDVKAAKALEGIVYADGTSVSAASLGWTKTGYSIDYFALDSKGKKPLTSDGAGVYDISKLGKKNGAKVKVYPIWDVDVAGYYIYHDGTDVAIAGANAAAAVTTGTSWDALNDKANPAVPTAASKKFNDLYKATKVAYGKSVKLSAASMPGYTFVGWTYDTVSYTGDADTMLVKNDKGYLTGITAKNNAFIELVAVFTPDTFTVKFNPNGGYYFKDDAQDTTETIVDADANGEADVVDCNIFADSANGAANRIAYATLLKNADAKITNVEKDGYVFAGFAYDKEGKKDITKTVITPKKGAVVVIYPIWTVPETVTIASVAPTSGTGIVVTLSDNMDTKYSYEVQYSTTIEFRTATTTTKKVAATGGSAVINIADTNVGGGTYFVRVRTVATHSTKDSAGKNNVTKGAWSVVKSN